MATEKTITNLRGPAARISQVTSETVPADQPAEVVMTGLDQDRKYHFKNPRGLPGVNAVENDTAVATYVNAEDSETHAAVMNKNIMRGNSGKFYRMTRCALRPVGAPNYWEIISDANHEPVGATSVTVSTTAITLNYPAGTTVSGGHVTVDEQMAGQGYVAGQSEGLSSMVIYLNRLNIADRLSWNGTTWVSSLSRFTVTGFSTVSGTLSISHDPIPGTGIAVAMIDASPLTVRVGSLGATTTVLFFYDAAGNKVLAPSTDMKIYLTRLGQGLLNPQEVPANASANLWVSADLEITV